MNKLHIFARNVLLILFLTYSFLLANAQGEGTLLMQVSVILIVLVSIFYFIKATFFLKIKHNLFFAWTAFTILNITGFVFTADYFDKRYYGPFLAVLVCLLTFYPFYYFSSKNLLSSKILVYFFLVLVPISIYSFYQNEIRVIESRMNLNTNVVNNVSYFFVKLMPFVFLIKRKQILSNGLMTLLVIFILLGSKRGAIIVGLFNLIVYIFFRFKTIEKRKKIQGLILTFISFVLLFYFTYDFYIENEFLLYRIESMIDGDSSGRDIIFLNIFETWYNSSNLFNYLFGYGFSASIVSTGGSLAHNDWLETLISFGLMGFLIYLILISISIKESFNKRKWDTNKRILLKVIVFSWLITSLFSMWYNNINGFTQSLLLAYLIGNNKRSLE